MRTGDVATLAHGYTMAQIDSMAFKAAVRSRSSVMDFDEKKEFAWGAIVEMLYAADEPPLEWELRLHGSDAIDSECRQILRSHGVRAGEAGIGENDEKPRFLQYWLPVAGPRHDFTEGLAERLALPQILAKLTDREYETISALAAHGNHKDAAESLGLTTANFSRRYYIARDRLWRFWFDWETPPPKTRTTADTCKYGHPKSEYGFVNNHGTVACRKCQRAAGRRSERKRKSAAQEAA